MSRKNQEEIESSDDEIYLEAQFKVAVELEQKRNLKEATRTLERKNSSPYLRSSIDRNKKNDCSCGNCSECWLSFTNEEDEESIPISLLEFKNIWSRKGKNLSGLI